MQITINLHSFIDVITNSSTEIFVECHNKSIEYVKVLIDSVLSIAGSDKTADDLFTFKIVEGEDDEYSSFRQDKLIITAKKNEKISVDLAERITEVFSIDGYYNG